MSDVLSTNSDSFQIYPVEVDSSTLVHKKYKHFSLDKLAIGVNLFVAHHAIPENTQGYATQLHITPSIIAQVAHKGKVRELLLSHRMKRTIGHEKETLEIIKKKYKGKVIFAEDRMKIEL